VQIDDTVGVLYRMVPGLCVFFAARVVDTFDGEIDGLWRTGFTYRTLIGHPEYGQETFSVEKNLATGDVMVALRSWSRPGTWLARLTSPLVRLMQVRASRAALRHIESAASIAGANRSAL